MFHVLSLKCQAQVLVVLLSARYDISQEAGYICCKYVALNVGFCEDRAIVSWNLSLAWQWDLLWNFGPGPCVLV